MKLQAAVEVFLGNFSNSATRRAYAGILNRLSAAIGPDRQVTHLTKIDLVQYANDLRDGNLRYANHPRRPSESGQLSESTFRKHVKGIKRFFRWMVEMELVEKSVADVLKARKPRRRDDRDKAASPGEIETLARYFYGHTRNWALFRFLVDTGCRAGGVATLRLSKLRLDEGEALVVEKFNKQRTVWFTQETAAALRAWLVKRPTWQHEFVFGTAKGPLKPDTVSLILVRACKNIGIRPLRAHKFRHALGFKFADAGIAPTIAAVVMGHDDAATTLDHYYPHDLERAQTAARQVMKTFFEEEKIVKMKKAQ